MRRVLLSPRWLALHLLALVLVAACLGLGWWQWERAGQGNARSLGYALEWPAFAGFVVLVWGYLVRDELRTDLAGERDDSARPGRDASGMPGDASGAAGSPTAAGSPDELEASLLPADPALTAARARAAKPAADERDDELAAYNDYLARLHAAEADSGRHPS